MFGLGVHYIVLCTRYCRPPLLMLIRPLFAMLMVWVRMKMDQTAIRILKMMTLVMMNNDRMTNDVFLHWYENLMLICIHASSYISIYLCFFMTLVGWNVMNNWKLLFKILSRLDVNIHVCSNILNNFLIPLFGLSASYFTHHPDTLRIQ